MSKARKSWGKHPIVTILSLGLIVLGIGCIIWAVLNILAPINYYKAANNTIGRSNFISDSFASELNKLTGDNNIIGETENKPTNLQNDKTFISIHTEKYVAVEPEKTVYPVYPSEGDNIGSLTIPTLKLKLTIFQGTDVEELRKGVGHFIRSVLPGEEDNCVLSGHRDTVFKRLGELKIGDQMIVQTSAGIFTYEIKSTRIVHKDDKTVIVPTEQATLTVTTCYPFVFVGNAPNRYIISADLMRN